MMDTTNQGEVAANPLYSESETEEDNSLRDEMEAGLTLCLKKLPPREDDDDFSEDDEVILNFK